MASSKLRIHILGAAATDVPFLRSALEDLGADLVWIDGQSRYPGPAHVKAASAAILFLGPDGHGSEQVRSLAEVCPVLIVTPPDAADLRLSGLAQGAIDYLVTPFSSNELKVRIVTAIQRFDALRQQWRQKASAFAWHQFSPAERQVLARLKACRGRPVSKTELKSATLLGSVTDNAIEVLMHRLRAKLAESGIRIRTCRGEGYMLQAPDSLLPSWPLAA